MADNDPLVSIIIPARDVESFIGGTLESALGQTYPNIEVVVVDDGSRDRTRTVVNAWVERDSRVRLLAQENRGVAASRNRAIATARGELIAPLDADDLWAPCKIERQVRRMLDAGEDTGLVYCWWTLIDVHGVLLDSSPRWRIDGDAADTLLQVNYTGNASVPLFRRRCLEEVGGYDVTLRAAEGCEDYDVALKVAERWRVAVVAAPLVAYRRRPDGLSGRTDRMNAAHALVIDRARQRRPGLPPALIRSSQDQFALYLAGVSFWSGAFPKAVRWGVRALRSSLALAVLPYVLRLLFRRRRQARPASRVIRPGVDFSTWTLPEPLIPYDRIYERRGTRRRRA